MPHWDPKWDEISFVFFVHNSCPLVIIVFSCLAQCAALEESQCHLVNEKRDSTNYHRLGLEWARPLLSNIFKPFLSNIFKYRKINTGNKYRKINPFYGWEMSLREVKWFVEDKEALTALLSHSLLDGFNIRVPIYLWAPSYLCKTCAL